MGLYVLLAEANDTAPRRKQCEKRCEAILQAFPPLKDIVLFAVNAENENFPRIIEYETRFSKT